MAKITIKTPYVEFHLEEGHLSYSQSFIEQMITKVTNESKLMKEIGL